MRAGDIVIPAEVGELSDEAVVWRPMPATLETAAPLVPPEPSLETLRAAGAGCQACPLWKLGTQTVFGEGGGEARLVFVGEQPGDKEDLAGRPFVGPAGRLLDEALLAAGIDRAETYVTNSVKHFKWTPAGGRRLHAKPTAREVAACRPWLDAELQVLKPVLVVALGATAAQNLMGKDFRVTQDRGKILRNVPFAPAFLATIHPSAILRGSPEDRAAGLAALVADLKVAAQALAQK